MLVKADVGESSLQLPIAPRPSRAFSLWLDFFRWSAALLVLCGHTERELLVRLTSLLPSQRSPGFYLYAFVSGFGHQAVMMFFVLSGYLVGGGLWREQLTKGSIDLRRYLLHRFTRMAVVVYPSFVVMLICSGIGIFAFQGLKAGVYTPAGVASLSPSVLACNVAFLQTAACDNYGKNGALWSLFNEFWYYIVWPILLLGLTASRTWKRIGLLTLASAALLGFTLLQWKGYSAFAPYMVIWLVGLLVATSKRALLRSPLAASCLFVLAMLLERVGIRESFAEIHPVLYFAIDLLLGALFANILIAMKHSPTLRAPIGGEINTKLAAFSFSLYCIHIPLLNLYSAFLNYYFHTGALFIPDGVGKWLMVLGGIVFCLVLSFVFSLATEAHTASVRLWLSSLGSATRIRRVLTRT